MGIFLTQGIFSCKYILHIFLFFFFPVPGIGKANRQMGLWPLAVKSYGPFRKSMGHWIDAMGQNKKKKFRLSQIGRQRQCVV